MWWLKATAAELDAARTCRSCGCKDADIDLGLCYDCFMREREERQQYWDERQAQYEADQRRAYERQQQESPDE